LQTTEVNTIGSIGINWIRYENKLSWNFRFG